MKTSELTESIELPEEKEETYEIFSEEQPDIADPISVDSEEMQELNITNRESSSEIEQFLNIEPEKQATVPAPTHQAADSNPASSNAQRQPLTQSKYDTAQDRISDGIGSGNRLSGEGTKKPSHSFVTRGTDNRRIVNATPAWRGAYV